MNLRVLMVALLMCCGSASAAVPPKAKHCVSTQASLDYRVPPSLICDYSSVELKDRLLSLLGVTGHTLTISDVENAFALPQLQTSGDDPRWARYDEVLGAGSGSGGWEVMLSFAETFYPHVTSRPPHFQGTGRPVLINPRRRGDLRLEFHWLQTGSITTGGPGCLNVQELKAAGHRYGWRESFQETMVWDVGPHVSFVLKRHRSEITTDLDEHDCIKSLTLTRESDPGVD